MAIGLNQTESVLALRVITGVQAIDLIENEWGQLARQQENTTLLQFPAYYQSFAATLGASSGSLSVIAAYRGTELVALIPVKMSTRRVLLLALRIFEFPDTPSPRRDALISPWLSCSDFIAALQRDLGGSWDAMRLSGIPEHSRLLEVDDSHRPGSILSKHTGYNNYFDLSTIDSLEKHVPSKIRNNLRRAKKRLIAMGDYTFTSADSLPALAHAFRQFLDVEASGWKSQRGGKRALKLHQDQIEFYLNLMNRLAKTRDCHIHLLISSEKTIAASFCVRMGNTIYCLKSGYDESYRKLAAGQLLREYMIDQYAADGSLSYLDLISDYKWQRQFKPQQRKVYDVYIFNSSLRGWILHLLLRIKLARDKNQ